MSERLFFALWPGDEQRRSLARVQRELSAQRGRQVHSQDIHITLVFLGEASAAQRACTELAAGAVGVAPFDLTLDRIGCFPRARVLWCGAGVCPRPLDELVAALKRELAACGFSPECRPYRPHATLVRKAVPLGSRPLVRPIYWHARDFVLACGQGGAPPRYRILRRWPLLP